MIFQGRNVFEIHPIYSNDESKRDKNGRENCQDLHDIVYIITYITIVYILLVGYHHIIDFNGF